MKFSTVASLFAFATLSLAASPTPQNTDLRPKYYFPRAIKRQAGPIFVNTTSPTPTSDLRLRQDNGTTDTSSSSSVTVVSSPDVNSIISSNLATLTGTTTTTTDPGATTGPVSQSTGTNTITSTG